MSIENAIRGLAFALAEQHATKDLRITLSPVAWEALSRELTAKYMRRLLVPDGPASKEGASIVYQCEVGAVTILKGEEATENGCMPRGDA